MSNIATNHTPAGQSSSGTDEALVAAAQGGSASAFESLVNRHFGLIYTLAFARLREHEAAQDLCQEVFLRLYIGLPTLREPKFFATWASRVTRNLAIDWVRNRQRASSLITLVPLEEPGVEHKPATGPGARERLLESEQLRELREAILRLPVEQREILLLHYQRGMTQQEIGARLDLHHSTVCRHLQRAVSQLQRWSHDLDSIANSPSRPGATGLRERHALARTMVLIGAAATLSNEARCSITSAAADGMARLGSAAISNAAANATVSPAGSAGAMVTKVGVLTMKGTLMTGKAKTGLIALAAVTALGATYHQTHPGELTQLLRGTTPSSQNTKSPGKPSRTFYTPTMGPGEEVYTGTLAPIADQIVVRMKPVAGGSPEVQFDVPGALIMEYPMKVVMKEGEHHIIEATGQIGLDVTHSPEALIGQAQIYGRRKDMPTTVAVNLKRAPAPLPIGRDLPPVAAVPGTNWLDQFVGEYVISSAMSIKVTRVGDQLYAQSARQDPLPIFHKGNGRFFYKAVPDEVSFFPGKEGKIVRLVLHGPRDIPGRKIS